VRFIRAQAALIAPSQSRHPSNDTLDTFTHALSGALLGRAIAPGASASVSRGDCVLLGFVAAAFPDSDVVFSLVSPLAYLHHHRGITHSFIALPLFALLLAWIWSRLRRNPAGFKTYFVVSALAIGIHILGDLITSFGTMVFAPLSQVRHDWGTTFILDPWLSGIIVAGLLASWALRRSRVPAIAALLFLCGYVSFQWMQQQQAVEVGEYYAREQGFDDVTVKALPRPVSPFNWMVIVAQRDFYHYAFVNLRRDRALTPGPQAGLIERLDSAYLPVASARWQKTLRLGVGEERALAEQVWTHPDFGFFRWFSAFPVLATVERGNPSVCVWFQDLRFLTPGRSTWPFRYGMCRNAAEPWIAYQAGDDGRHIKLQP